MFLVCISDVMAIFNQCSRVVLIIEGGLICGEDITLIPGAPGEFMGWEIKNSRSVSQMEMFSLSVV